LVATGIGLRRAREAITASIKAAQKLPGVDGSRTLVIGASEGGIVAVRVSNVLPSVTHAASLAGGGPVHLYDLAEYVRRRGLDPENEVYGCWQQILRDPDNEGKFCWGHPYRMLSSFMKTSLIEECLRSKARLYLAHGTADEQNFIAGFDVMHAELAAKKRDAVFLRIEGADHAMNRVGQSPPEGLIEVFGRVVDWFLRN
jgi:dipeptidyl aminopeptidase/acylaminoacyl peptidase